MTYRPTEKELVIGKLKKEFEDKGITWGSIWMLSQRNAEILLNLVRKRKLRVCDKCGGTGYVEIK